MFNDGRPSSSKNVQLHIFRLMVSKQ